MEQFLTHNVNLYEEKPDGITNIQDLVQMANERLELYKIFIDNEFPTITEIKTSIDSPLQVLLDAQEILPSETLREARKRDYLSHWILRVAYSTVDPQFFIECEIKWFELRFNILSKAEQLQIFTLYREKLPTASIEEKTKFDLNGTCYKVIFNKVPFLVSNRLCVLHKGFAFVPEDKLGYILIERLKRKLHWAVNHIQKLPPDCNEQMNCILEMLNLIKPQKYYSNKRLQLDDLQESAQHFPLCMKVIYELLKSNHHLKHRLRFQLGLFLKGIGLSCNDSMKFWQEEFTQIMTEKRFVKDYSYFFKHIYGLVGSKINYTPQNCQNILQSGGCPFKEWTQEVLISKLQQEVTDATIHQIVSLKNDRKYKEACSKFFEDLHECKLRECITHPICFYEKSCDVDIEDLVI